MEEQNQLAIEKHYSADQLAELWAISADTVRKIFRDDPDVLKIGAAETRSKRGYVVLRIPESVVRRTHAKLTRRLQ
jgi:hypothetical protein